MSTCDRKGAVFLFAETKSDGVRGGKSALFEEIVFMLVEYNLEYNILELGLKLEWIFVLLLLLRHINEICVVIVTFTKTKYFCESIRISFIWVFKVVDC